jgi:competence protein ComEA
MVKSLLIFLLSVLVTASAWAVEINQATEAELDSIKGLGPSTTLRILKERDKSNFKDWADFMARIKGIKQATAKKLSDAGLTVQGAPFSTPTNTNSGQ